MWCTAQSASVSLLARESMRQFLKLCCNGLPPATCGAASAADAVYNPDQNAAAGGSRTMYVRFAATLDGIGGSTSASGSRVAAFDADAFRLTRTEGALMDPHARLLLGHSAEAVADARGRLLPGGLAAVGSVDAIGGSSTGVYVGCMWSTGEAARKRAAAGCLPAACSGATQAATVCCALTCRAAYPWPTVH